MRRLGAGQSEAFEIRTVHILPPLPRVLLYEVSQQSQSEKVYVGILMLIGPIRAVYDELRRFGGWGKYKGWETC